MFAPEEPSNSTSHRQSPAPGEEAAASERKYPKEAPDDNLGDTQSAEPEELRSPYSTIGASYQRNETEARFNETLGERVVQQVIHSMASCMTLRSDAPERANGTLAEDAARDIASSKYVAALERIILDIDSPFRRFLIALSEAPYYDKEIRSSLRCLDGYYETMFSSLAKLIECLPAPVRETVAYDELISSACNGANFALLFKTNDRGVRRIITIDRSIELEDVYGYKYLDVSADGAPFARCVTERGGGRAFFDGTRLMSHRNFQTCAPRVDFFSGGYIVNSTKCTIVNGFLYPLINTDDVVAYTTGALFGIGDWSTPQILASYSQNEALSRVIRVDEEGVIHLPNQSVKPIGFFKPSTTRLLENGCTAYEWSEFVEF
jgi:hypothetical protein